jgi:hypothetical protein
MEFTKEKPWEKHFIIMLLIRDQNSTLPLECNENKKEDCIKRPYVTISHHYISCQEEFIFVRITTT